MMVPRTIASNQPFEPASLTPYSRDATPIRDKDAPNISNLIFLGSATLRIFKKASVMMIMPNGTIA